jgi:hypothetical protein
MQTSRCQKAHWKVNHRIVCAPTLPYEWLPLRWPTRQFAQDGINYAIAWETSRWIVGHYDIIGNTALHAAGLIKLPEAPDGAFNPEDTICITLVAETNPSSLSYAPLRVVGLQYKTAEEPQHLSSCSLIEFYPDPSQVLLDALQPHANKAYLR